MQGDPEDSLPGFGELPDLDMPPQKKALPKVSSSSPQELPRFEEEDFGEEADEPLDVPTPPPELKENSWRSRLQSIEDEYLESGLNEEAKEMGKIAPSALFLSKRPVFVNLSDYGKLISTLKGSRTNFRRFSEKFVRLDKINLSQVQELNNMRANFEDLQRNLIAVDNRLFEKLEEWDDE